MYLLMLQYIPHGHCYLWKPVLIWLFTSSDGVIALSYFAISALILYLWSRTTIKISPWQDTAFFGFVCFVSMCGITHVFNVVEIWMPLYNAHAAVELGTAIVSALTAIAFFPVATGGVDFVANSVTDTVTGLYTRRFVEFELQREKERCDREMQALAIILLDLDNLKLINDGYGHQGGDAALAAIGRTLREDATRDYDILGRTGGDEMLIAIPKASIEVAAVRAEEIRNAIASLDVRARDGRQIPISCSVGVAVYPKHGKLEDAIAAADAALYEAKRKGKNCVCVAG